MAKKGNSVVHEPKNILSPRQRIMSLRAKKFPTPFWLVWFFLFLIAVIIIFVVRTQSGANILFPAWITFEPTNYSRQIQEETFFTLTRFDQLFPCGRSITIANKENLSTSVHGEPGFIYLNPHKLNLATFADDIRRQAFRACKPNRVLLRQPIYYRNYDVIAFEGLNWIVRNPSRTIGEITYMEDAVVDYLTITSFSDQATIDVTQFSNLGKEVMKKISMSPQELAELLKKTDETGVQKFVADYLDKPYVSINPANIGQAGYDLQQIDAAGKNKK
jgi:hypothetical protein